MNQDQFIDGTTVRIVFKYHKSLLSKVMTQTDVDEAVQSENEFPTVPLQLRKIWQ